MNSSPQLDLHPDADSLNAFVEQVLTEPERAQILSHLAGCSRCRQVIFVAQQAVYAMEPEEVTVAAAAAPSPIAAAHPEPVRPRPVPSVWRVALIPAAALAAAVAISVFAYVAHTRQTSELARNALQAAPQAAHSPSQPLAKKNPTPPGSTVDSIEGRQAVDRLRIPDRAKIGPTTHGTIYPNAPMPPRSPIPPLTSDKNAPLSAPLPVVQGFAATQFKPLPQASGQRVAGPMAGVGGVPRNAQAQTQGTVQTSAASLKEPETVSVSQLQVESAAQSNFSLARRQEMGKVAAVRKEPPAMLPSGLRATSTVSAQHRILAVDSLGALFLSTDAGLHWDAVPQQWEGRALIVRFPAKPWVNSSSIAAFASAGSSKSNESSPADSTSPEDTSPLFEIITESNHTWVSADGRIWKQKSF